MTMNDCKFKRTCTKYGTAQCAVTCYPYVMLHGVDGKGGFIGAANIPGRYREYLVENLPIADTNPKVYKAVEGYVRDILSKVKTGRGIYFVGGTGTGKTTTAVTILNEYVIARTRQLLRKEGEPVQINIGYFIRLAELQNTYNAQFKDEAASAVYYRCKLLMTKSELVVIDDIALRSIGEGFQNELFDILDYRSAVDGLTTIFTSNVDYAVLITFVGERITSRIEGMCGKEVKIIGQDSRKGGLF